MANAEKIGLQCGRVDIQATPDAFPLGARGQRPVRFTVLDDDLIAKVKTLGIPGVIVRGRRIDCAWDAAPVVAELLGEPHALDAALQYRLTCPLPLPGKKRYDELGLQKIRREYQGEGARFLLRRAYAILGDFPRAGKCLQILIVVVLIDAEKTLIICNSLGKYVWAEEIAKWLGEPSALLFGRAGHEARFFCVPCMGRGAVPNGQIDDFGTPLYDPCRACRRRGVSRGETTFTVRKLEQETVAEVYFTDTGKLKKDGTPRMQRRVRRTSVEPPTFRCPKHKDEVDTVPRPCGRCKAELLAKLDATKFVIVNYDILIPQKDKDDWGAATVRADLPGWGPILSRYKFALAVADESHKLRGWQSKGPGAKEAQTRRERANEVCAEIPRVYAVTGTPVYGFVRDLWGQLDFVSGGLWS